MARPIPDTILANRLATQLVAKLKREQAMRPDNEITRLDHKSNPWKLSVIIYMKYGPPIEAEMEKASQ